MILGMYTRDGSQPKVRKYLVGGSDAIPQGALVKLSNDTIIACADDDVKCVGVLMEAVTAAEAAAGTKYAYVTEVDDQLLLEMRFTLGGGSLPSNPLHDYYGLDVDANGYPVVDLSETTAKLFKLVEITRNGTTTGHTAGDLRCVAMIPSSVAEAIIEQ